MSDSTSTDARAETARANGAKGGRPRSKLEAELLAELSPPPTDNPLELARWAQVLEAKILWWELQGRIPAGLAQSVRAHVGALVRAMPTAIAADLDRRLREDRDETEADQAGPKLEERHGDTRTAVRRAPR